MVGIMLGLKRSGAMWRTGRFDTEFTESTEVTEKGSETARG
jgi:hypothetical protein